MSQTTVLTPDEKKVISRQAENLTEKIKQLSSIYNGQILRCGFQASIASEIAGVPKHQDYIFSFFNTSEVPPEFVRMINDYCQRLISEREDLWNKLR